MMLKKKSLPLVISVIILAALALAALADMGISFLEKKEHPLKYKEHVEEYCSEYNIPEYIVFAIIKVESGFDPTATSSVGAVGLMQMMPSTFRWLTSADHLAEYLSPAALYEPRVSIRYGCYYLRYLFEKFQKWDTVFAAYNGGEGNVAKWLNDREYSDANGNLVNIPFKETKNYVKKVNDAIDFYKDTYYTDKEIVK